VIAWATALGTVSWAAVLFAAPYCAAHCATRSAGFAGSTAAYLLASVICHQHADRSFHLWGVQLPVCARCTGLYAGAAAGALAAVAAAERQRWRRLRDRSSQSLGAWRIGLIVAAVPTAVTVVLERLFGLGIPNASRAWAGGVLGAAVAWIVVSSIRGRGSCAEGTPEVDCSDASIEGGAAPDR